MPSTVNGIVLLGWMEKDDAVQLLTKDSHFDPPLTEKQAEELWEKYRDAVSACPVRTCPSPTQYPIPPSCQSIVQHFLQRLRGPEVQSVINVDPMGLHIYQLYVVTDRADHHAQKLKGNEWAKLCLQIDRPNAPMRLRMEDQTIKVDLPHAEHLFAAVPGGFQIQQGGGFISVCNFEGRLLLKAGYHRSFAFSRARTNEPEAKDRSLLVAVTKTVPPQLLASFPKQGLRTTVLGSRPPLFSDFFNDSLAMTIKLRKKRYEMHIKVNVVPIDET